MPKKRRKKKIKLTKKDLKLFAVMCLIALIVGAGIVLVDEKSRALIDSFQQSTLSEIQRQAEIFKAREMKKNAAGSGAGDQAPTGYR